MFVNWAGYVTNQPNFMTLFAVIIKQTNDLFGAGFGVKQTFGNTIIKCSHMTVRMLQMPVNAVQLLSTQSCDWRRGRLSER